LKDQNGKTLSNLKIVLDSGASFNVCNDISLLNNLEKCSKYGDEVSGNQIHFTMKGSLTVRLKNGNEITFTDVYFSENVSTTLISVGIIHSKGATVDFKKCKLYGRDGTVLSNIVKHGNIYVLPSMNYEQNNGFSALNLLTMDEWHNKLGHISKGKIAELERNGLISIKQNYSSNECIICPKGKMARLPFKMSKDIWEKLLLVIFCKLVNRLLEDQNM
jgi:hypothetical protein